jgi:hypothetical protein
MDTVIYGIAGLAAFGAVLSVVACVLAKQRLRRETKAARVVAQNAVEKLAKRAGVEAKSLRAFGQGRRWISEPDLEEMGEEKARAERQRNGLAYVRQRLASDPRLGGSERLRDEFLYSPQNKHGRGGSRSAVTSVAEIPLEVFATDPEVRANVLGGLTVLDWPASDAAR